MKDNKETRPSQPKSDTHMHSQRRSHHAQGLYLSALNRVLKLRGVVDTDPPLNQLSALDNFLQIKKLVFCDRVLLGIQSILTGRPYAQRQKAKKMNTMAFLKVLFLIMLCQAFFLFLCRSFEYILWDFGVCKCMCHRVQVHMCFSCFSFGSFSDVCLLSLVIFCCFILFYYC